MSVLVYVLNMAILLGLVRGLRRQGWAQEIRAYFYPALLLKLLCGVLLGLLYFRYYGAGDTTVYYKGSLLLTELAHQDAGAYLHLLYSNEFPGEAFRAAVPFSRFPGFTNSFFLLKILSLLNLLTGSSYYLNGLYFSLFSFWGAAKLAATLARLFPKYKPAAAVAFLFFPSVVFWSSGVLKDPLLFGSMSWLVALALLLGQRQRVPWRTWLLAPLLLLLFCRVKLFLALLVLPLLLLYLLVKMVAHHYPPLQPHKRQALALAISAVVFVLAGTLVFRFYLDGFFYRNLVSGYQQLLAQSQGRPHIAFGHLEPTIGSFAWYAPQAVWSAIYRPFVWEASSLLYLLPALENLVLLLLSLAAVAAAVRGQAKPATATQVLFIAIVLVLAALFGLSTPNFGTLSRYRIAFLPYLVYLLLQSPYALRWLRVLRAEPEETTF